MHIFMAMFSFVRSLWTHHASSHCTCRAEQRTSQRKYRSSICSSRTSSELRFYLKNCTTPRFSTTSISSRKGAWDHILTKFKSSLSVILSFIYGTKHSEFSRSFRAEIVIKSKLNGLGVQNCPWALPAGPPASGLTRRTGRHELALHLRAENGS